MRRIVACGFTFFALIAVFAYAQQQPGPAFPQPRITSVFPMGAQVGTSVEVTVNGTDIDDPTALAFSHPDIKAELAVAPEAKPDPMAKDKMAPPKAKAKTGPQTSAKFKVTVPANVPLGTHDVRVIGRLGISNPRAFVVSDKPEVLESDKPHNDVPDAQKIDLGKTVNGTISAATDVDYYSFPAKAGKRVVASCLTTSIDSKARVLVELFDSTGKRLQGNRNYKEGDALVDFTPVSDGDYILRISEFAYQSGGADYFYRLTVSNAPWIDAVFPPAVKAGQSSEVTLIGRNLPGGKLDPATGLESAKVTITAPADAEGKFTFRGFTPPTQALQDAFEFSLTGPGGKSNIVPIYLTNQTVIAEKEAENDKPETAQEIAVPCEVAGRIEKRYDKDWYRFTAKKGDTYTIELFADRIGSGMDMYFAVKNPTNMGNVVEEQDDDPDSLHPFSFYTRSGDPAAAKFVAPADGQFVILVASRESNITYGPRSVYRLKVSKLQPDFRAVVLGKGKDLPNCPVAGQGGEVALDVFVDRRDGFNGPITVKPEGLPAGVTAKPAIIGSGSKWGTLVLSSSESAAAFNGILTFQCSATIDGKTVTRTARPATISWGLGQQNQNVPTITRLDQAFFFAVRPEKAPLRITADLAGIKVKTKDKDGKDTEVAATMPLYVKPGDKVVLPVKAKWQGVEARANPISLSIEPYQVNSQNAPIGATSTGGGNGNPPSVGMMPKDKDDAPLTLDIRSAAIPGTYSIVIRGDTQVSYLRDPTQKDKKTNATAVAYAAPLEITVLPSTVAKLTIAQPTGNSLKLGTTVDVVVKVERQFDYAGEFQLSLVIPKEYKGISVTDATIPAGKDEGTIKLMIAADAKVGALQGVSVTAIATLHGKFPVKQELKVTNWVIAK